LAGFPAEAYAVEAELQAIEPAKQKVQVPVRDEKLD
jgi:hypothetical protein